MIMGSRLISLLVKAFPLFAVGYVTKDMQIPIMEDFFSLQEMQQSVFDTI